MREVVVLGDLDLQLEGVEEMIEEETEGLLRGGDDLPQDGEILLPDDSETILQDATMDLPIGVVTDLLLLLLHEMINPHRTNPLASLTKVGPRWPSVSRFQPFSFGLRSPLYVVLAPHQEPGQHHAVLSSSEKF